MAFTKTYKFDGGEIIYKAPIYTDLLRLFGSMDMEKLGELSPSQQLLAMADKLEPINDLVLEVKFKDYKSKEEAFTDPEIMPHMTGIFTELMSTITQSGEAKKKRKKR